MFVFRFVFFFKVFCISYRVAKVFMHPLKLHPPKCACCP